MNKTGEECGGFHCDYRKNNDPLNFDGLDVLLAKQVTMLETENGELYQEVVKLREENRILKENKK